MADKLDLIYDMVKETKESQKAIQSDVGDIKLVQAEQAIILEEHQKVSAANAKRIDHIEDVKLPEMDDKFTPKPIEWKKTISWGVVVVSGIAGIVGKVMGWF